MLNANQITSAWEHMLAAEVRALYFADLTARFTRHKQAITGLSFFLSSGAAAAIIAKAPAWVPLLLALVVAAMTAYAMAVQLDGRIATMAKLHATWSQIATRYDRLWNHAYDADAADQFDSLLNDERAPSELAATSAPNNQKLLAHWEDRVIAMYHLPATS